MDIDKKIVIENELGLHARPAALFVQTANKFEADIYVQKNNERVNGKSIMGLMMLAAEKGSTVRLIISGDDAAEAFEALNRLLKSKFGEK